ncbi:putative NADPH dehydrogenase [Spathaspora sp. JA1]|nr:putative NADPH dehydrogenase [Spathaspora sp. JA1]
MTKSDSLAETNLFKPIKLGNVELSHRVVHAPTSRSRNHPSKYIITDIMLEYYKLRSRNPGTLIITESIMVSPETGLLPYKAGVWDYFQIRALRKLTDVIHDQGSFVSVQLVGAGRTANIEKMERCEIPYIAPSAIYHTETHRETAEKLGWHLAELTIDEIHEIQDHFVHAAVNCITRAGADFVELHGTSGFLIEQFLSPLSNQRVDEYGGSVENRCRFLLEILDKCIAHPDIGAKKTAIRISPWSTHNGMVYPGVVDYMAPDQFPPLEFCQYIMKQLELRKQNGSEIAYLSITEPRVTGSSDADPTGKSNDPLLQYWSGKIVRSGGYATNYKGDPFAIKSNAENLRVVDGRVMHYEALLHDVADDRTLIGFSRPFCSNPDLVSRLEHGYKLDMYDREFFYTHCVKGYLDVGDYSNDYESNELTLSEEELSREGIALDVL